MKKLHLGCGERNFGEDWIHIDNSQYEHIKYHDVCNLSQFKNNSVGLIYASHLIAYFDRDEVIMVLNEWKRVLKPGGTLRIATPHLRNMMYLYVFRNLPIENFLGPLYGKWKTNDKYVYHKTVYDFESLTKLLLDVGFKNIKMYDWRKTEHAQFDDFSQAYIPHLQKESGTLISLNIECNR